jgi:hypothetical protein
MRHFVNYATLLSVFFGFANSAVGNAACLSDAKTAGVNKLAIFSEKGKLLRGEDSGKISLSSSLSSHLRFGFYLPSSRGREGGMLLIKVTDFATVGTKPDVPARVHLSRSASKRYSWFKKFRMVDVAGLNINSSSVSVLEYQLVHLLKERINLTGDLLKFHREYTVGSRNKSTYRRDLRQRILFAFEDVLLNLPEEKRKILLLAISNVSQEKLIPDAVAKVIGQVDKPAISAVSPISNLESRLYYYEKIDAGGGLNFCFEHRPNIGVLATKFEIVDVDPDEDGGAERLVNLRVNWTNP